MKANVYDEKGSKVSSVDLPAVFAESVRDDVISRAVLSIESRSRQKYGASPMAGKQHVTNVSKRRHDYRGCYGHGISRVPRKVLSRSGIRFNWVGALMPGTVGGRRAHPPKASKNWELKINKKEKRLAIRSAIAATIDESYVTARGHKFTDVSCVLDDACENIEKTKDVFELFNKIGLGAEMERVSKKKIRAGVGTMRGRKYKTKVGPLVVVSKVCPLVKSAANVSGVDVIDVTRLNAKTLAPGAQPGRLTIWTKDALKKLEGLFV